MKRALLPLSLIAGIFAFAAVTAFVPMNTEVYSWRAPIFASLPPIPDSIPSALGWVRVHKVVNLKCGGVDALGCFQPLTRTLSIRDSLELTVGWQTLKHEQLHMTIFDAGIFIPEDVQDELADAVGAQDVRVMLQH
jgi:hypothetical protein